MKLKTLPFIFLMSMSFGISASSDTDSGLLEDNLSTFKGALKTHLDAIDNRDYEKLITTLTTEDTLTLIYPEGYLIKEKSKYLDSHRSFFQDKSWTLNYRIIREVESSEMGFALLKCSFDTINPDGTPYQIDYFLTLVFQKISGKWLLVHDQNTKSKFKKRVLSIQRSQTLHN